MKENPGHFLHLLWHGPFIWWRIT